jgi:HlyD family secretion protein
MNTKVSKSWETKGLKSLSGLTIALLAAALLLAACSGTKANSEPTPAAGAVPTTTPVRDSGEVIAEAVVVPAQSASLSLPAGGIVAEALVAEGDTVQQGQVLLKLDSARQVAAVAQAEAGLKRAQAGLEELKSGARPQEVAAAQAAVEAAQAGVSRLEAGAQPEEIAAAQAAVAAAQAGLAKLLEGPQEEQRIAASAEVANAEAALKQAQASYDRVAGQADIAARPEALQLEQATNAYNTARARYQALEKNVTAADIAGGRARVREAQAQLDALKAPARQADLDATRAELRRAQAQLDLLQAGARPEQVAAGEADVASAAAALEQAKAALADTELRAPFAGTVAQLDVKAGEQAAPGAPVARLADLSAWHMETDDLTELDIAKVREGEQVTLTFDALPGLELSGKVERIKPIGQNKQGDMTYTVVVVPQQTDPRLRWNMTAVVKFPPE